MPVYFILELLSNGWSVDDIVGVYPGLAEDGVLAAIRYATKVLGGRVIVEALNPLLLSLLLHLSDYILWCYL
jgi:uncharacterized protein (DUF433 family)